MSRAGDKLRALRAGAEPTVTARGMLDEHRVGDVPPPEARAVLMLASALHRSRSSRVAVSWEAQCEAADYFNEHGLGKTLDRIVELDGPDALD